MRKTIFADRAKMSDEERRLIEEFLRKRGRVYKDKIPTSVDEASRLFYCEKLTFGKCAIRGEDCARRHANASSRWRTDGIGFDVSLYNAPHDRNDQTCSTCETGSARAELLKIKTKTRRRRERPKHGRALSAALQVSPREISKKLNRPTITTADLRMLMHWTENTIKKWLIHYESEGQIRRSGRVGLFIRFDVVYSV